MAESYNLFFEKICRTDEILKYPFLCKTDLRNIYGFEIRVQYSWQNILNVLKNKKKTSSYFSVKSSVRQIRPTALFTSI